MLGLSDLQFCIPGCIALYVMWHEIKKYKLELHVLCGRNKLTSKLIFISGSQLSYNEIAGIGMLFFFSSFSFIISSHFSYLFCYKKD